MLDDRRSLFIASIVRVLFPVIYVDIRDASDEELKFAFVKNVDEVWWYKLVEACHECIELLFDSLLDPPFGHQTGTKLALESRAFKSTLTHSIYSFLFSLLRVIFAPPGFNSSSSFSPNLSSSTVKVCSKTLVGSLSLKAN